ncbi:MAG: hypothetical protein SFV52_14680 [Saprospiraceae bacterium]|nr:hypothetical protein [Saprospiraceae bacterium]
MNRRCRLTVPILLALLGLFSCKKDETKPGFDMPYQVTFDIPPGINAFDTHYFNLFNISSQYQTFLAQQGVPDSLIVSINTQQAGMSGIFGDESFNFIQEVSLRIFDERKPDDWLEIAYRSPTPLEPGNRLDLIPTLVDARRFLQNPRFSLAVVLRLRQTPPVEVPVRLNLVMRAQYR